MNKDCKHCINQDYIKNMPHGCHKCLGKVNSLGFEPEEKKKSCRTCEHNFTKKKVVCDQGCFDYDKWKRKK